MGFTACLQQPASWGAGGLSPMRLNLHSVITASFLTALCKPTLEQALEPRFRLQQS